MGTINPATVSDGETIDASDLNNPINTIADEINGNLDANNLASDAVSTAKIQDGAVTPAKLLSGTGATWVWQDWTPSYTGLTVVNGTVVAKYAQHGKTVFFTWDYTVGSSDTVGTFSAISLPVTAATNISQPENHIAVGNVYDASPATNYLALGRIESGATTIRPLVMNVATYVKNTGITGSAPITFTTGDKIMLTGFYEAA